MLSTVILGLEQGIFINDQHEIKYDDPACGVGQQEKNYIEAMLGCRLQPRRDCTTYLFA